MVSKEDISYCMEMQENISIGDIRQQYEDGILIWIAGSGKTEERPYGEYHCLLDYNGSTKYLNGKVENGTANQSMIEGVKAAVSCIVKPMWVVVISSTTLGFEKGFNGRGTNGIAMEMLLELIKEKQCTLTEVRFIGGAEAIKIFISEVAPEYKSNRKAKEVYVSEYKKKIYAECLQKVVGVLNKNQVSKSVIKEVSDIINQI